MTGRTSGSGIYVEDNCAAVDLVLREGEVGEVYNIGNNVEKTTLEMTEAILEAVGASAELIEFVEDRPGHDRRYPLDSTKIRELGWEPTNSLEEGLESTLTYYLE